jgi:hypothetical protein
MKRSLLALGLVAICLLVAPSLATAATAQWSGLLRGHTITLKLVAYRDNPHSTTNIGYDGYGDIYYYADVHAHGRVYASPGTISMLQVDTYLYERTRRYVDGILAGDSTVCIGHGGWKTVYNGNYVECNEDKVDRIVQWDHTGVQNDIPYFMRYISTYNAYAYGIWHDDPSVMPMKTVQVLGF